MSEFFIADNHAFHYRIIELCQRKPLGRDSLFVDEYEMNDYMVKQWNSVVGKNDTVRHLGDFGFCQNLSDLRDFFNRLNGNIHLVIGNHDKHSKMIRKRLDMVGFKTISDYPVLWDNRLLLSHSPILNPKYVNIHGHLHEKPSPSPWHISVSVELWDYKPVPLEVIEGLIKERNLK